MSNYMSPKWIFEQFCTMFPQYGSSENIVYRILGSNTIKIEFKNPIYPVLIFSYNHKHDWKLVTERKYNEEEKSIEELRTALSNQQTLNRNIRRSKS